MHKATGAIAIHTMMPITTPISIGIASMQRTKHAIMLSNVVSMLHIGKVNSLVDAKN
jgi:hypothetical protein